MTANLIEHQPSTSSYYQYLPTYSQTFAGLGAIGIALQNYPAVVLFISSLTGGIIPASRSLDWAIQIAAISTGGVCSGVVNYWMNLQLLKDFFARMTSNKDYQYKKLSTWKRLQYFSGIFVFVITGILFGLMAFTFVMEGPLALLSIAACLFVAGIMTVQELETWLSSFDEIETPKEPEAPLSTVQYIGKWIGHIIAVGNVLALSLLFTLSLAQFLISFQVATIFALQIGFLVAFTAGAFTEYYFYNAYLADFCKNFSEKITRMIDIPHAWFGILCVSTNAFVNASLTYTGIELLTALVLTTHIALPPLVTLTVLAGVSAVFAGMASFILGLDFWIKQNDAQSSPNETTSTEKNISPSSVQPIQDEVSFKGSDASRAIQFGIFAANDEHTVDVGYPSSYGMAQG